MAGRRRAAGKELRKMSQVRLCSPDDERLRRAQESAHFTPKHPEAGILLLLLLLDETTKTESV